MEYYAILGAMFLPFYLIRISIVKLIGKIIRAGQHLFRNNYIIWDLATCGTMKAI